MKLIDYITVDIDSNDRVVGIELCDYLVTKVQKLSGEKKYIREKPVQKYLSLEYHLIREFKGIVFCFSDENYRDLVGFDILDLKKYDKDLLLKMTK